MTSIATPTRALRRGGLALAASALVFGAAALPGSPTVALTLVLAGAAVQVVGEALLGAGSWHLGFTVADPDRPGQWQGPFSSGLPLARAVGPIVLSTLVLTWTGPGWVVLAAVFGGAGLALRPVASWAERRQPIRNPDEIAALICLIVTINAWNAIGVSTRTWQPGTYQPD